MKNLALLSAIFGLALAGCNDSAPKADIPPFAVKVAEAAGLGAFENVTELTYTFNVRKEADGPVMSRGWVWKPQAGEVTMIPAEGESVTYNRADLEGASEEAIKADKAFINDQYWLIFPFHLVWDTGVTVTVGEGTSPIEGTTCKVVEAQYDSESGYTPGDLYKLYTDDEGMVMEWAFHPGGAPEPARVTKWTAYEDKGGLKISMDRDSTQGFKIWFTDVSVKTGS